MPISLNGTSGISASGNITGNSFIGNGSQLTGVGANTGNVTFNNQAVVGTGDQQGASGLYLAPGTQSVGNLQYLRVRGGDLPTHIHLDTGNNTYFDQYFGDDNKYVKLANTGNIVINTNNLVDASAQWTFGTDGRLTFPGTPRIDTDANNFEVQAAENINLEANVVVNIYTDSSGNTYQWQFGDDGSLTFPIGVSIDANVDPLYPKIIADSGKLFSVQGQGNTGSAALAWSIDPNVDSQYAAVGVNRGGGDDLAKVVLTVANTTATLKVWKFDQTGVLSLPNGATIRDTAGNSVAFGINAGQSSQGIEAVAIGDSAGNVSQGQYAVAMGFEAGKTNQGAFSVAVGYPAGQTNQGNSAVAIGSFAGAVSQSTNAVAVGVNAGTYSQGIQTVAVGALAGANVQGTNSVAIGVQAGYETQGVQSVAIGIEAGKITQGQNSVAIGTQAGNSAQGQQAVAIGYLAGNTTQGNNSVAIGRSAGETQGQEAVAIGLSAGFASQGNYAVAIGKFSANSSQGNYAVAVGPNAGFENQSSNAVSIGSTAGVSSQGINSVAIGVAAAYNTQGNSAVAVGNSAGYLLQGLNSVAIGDSAGFAFQGANAVAIGRLAGNTNQANNSIIINATGAVLDQPTANTFTVAPIRNDVANIGEVVFYNTTSKEITYGNTISVTGNITGNTAGFAIGYRDIPQVAFTANATIAATDAGKHYYSTLATANALTIANNTSVPWTVGTAITVVNRGSGNVVVTQGTGVSLYLAGNSTPANRTVTTYGMATLLNVAANVWMINGTGVS